jgi:hypothetical protein
VFVVKYITAESSRHFLVGHQLHCISGKQIEFTSKILQHFLSVAVVVINLTLLNKPSFTNFTHLAAYT